MVCVSTQYKTSVTHNYPYNIFSAMLAQASASAKA